MLSIAEESDDLEPKSIEECRRRNNWPKWEDAIQTNLKRFAECEVIEPESQTPKV